MKALLPAMMRARTPLSHVAQPYVDDRDMLYDN
jgi:hypothetical protein